MLRRSRRTVCGGILGIALAPSPLRAAADLLVQKNPNCGCCTTWAKQAGAAGSSVRIEESSGLGTIRGRLAVPVDLAACHTAEVEGYVVERHAPVIAISGMLAKRPDAAGIADPGVPRESPGMSGRPQKYAVILFGPRGRRTYMQSVGSEELG